MWDQTDEMVDRNMFFWFFPAMNGDESAPLVIWLQGGPGGSSLFGLFHEIGPWKLVRGPTGDVQLRQREITWNQRYSLLFIDNPVSIRHPSTRLIPLSRDNLAHFPEY